VYCENSSMNKLFLICYFCFSYTNLYALTIDEAKNKCLELGFKSDTEQLGNCVLKLSKPEAGQTSTRPETSIDNPSTHLLNVITTKFFKDCNVCPEMVEIPSGSFLMGSNDEIFLNNIPFLKNEKPIHKVEIKSFAVGKYEVTQEEYFLIMDSNPSSSKGRNLPVVNVSWRDAKTFVKKLSQKTGKKYRLLSEAEWEYAARGGSSTTYPWGNSINEIDLYAWYLYENNPNISAKDVGSKKANQFGIHDMLGNVYEWVEDCWHENYVGAPSDGSAWVTGDCSRHVLRSSAWFLDQKSMRPAFRSNFSESGKDLSTGFRVARDL